MKNNFTVFSIFLSLGLSTSAFAESLVSQGRPTSASSQYSVEYPPKVAVDGVLDAPAYYTWWGHFRND